MQRVRWMWMAVLVPLIGAGTAEAGSLSSRPTVAVFPRASPTTTWKQAVKQQNFVNLLLNQQSRALTQTQTLIRSQDQASRTNVYYGVLRKQMPTPASWVNQAIRNTAIQVNRFQAMINSQVRLLQARQAQISYNLAIADQLSRGFSFLQPVMAQLNQRTSALSISVQVTASRPAKTPVYPM